MKTVRFVILLWIFSVLLSSCGLFKLKYGCGDNGGKNVGAEKLLDGSAPKKAKKFKA